jgi:hypothetical protein
MYDEEPQIATAETMFLDRVGALIDGHFVHPAVLRPEPRKAQPPRAQPPRAQPPRVQSARVQSARVQPPKAQPTVPSQRPTYEEPPPREERPPVTARAAAPPAAQQTRRLLDPVMYDGSDIVTVDKRTPLQKLTGHNETDADGMSRLERDGRAVALVELVFVPDDGVVSRAVTKRRNAIAVELDEAFASVTRDVETELPAHVAVEVLTGTNPVQKHGVLRVAGEMTEAMLPKVKIEYFSIAETLRPLLDAAERTARGLTARGIEVVSKHFVFLAAMRFPADETTKDDWRKLLGDARVTWVDFSVGEPGEEEYPPLRSPFGLHVLTDKEDVLTLIRKQSEVLYHFGPDVREPETSEVDGSPADARRWWPWGKRPTD